MTSPQDEIPPSVSNVGLFFFVSFLADPFQIQLEYGNPSMNVVGSRFNPAANF